MEVHEDEFQYDQFGRILYNPKYHSKHKTFFTEEDIEYLCKYCEIDGLKYMSHALDRPEATLSSKIYLLRKTGEFEYYKNLNKHW